MVRAADVLIVGGGPAGSAAARLLALWGHRVRLITRPPSRTAAVLAESLPPSCNRLFGVLGVTEAVARAGFVRSTGNTVWWGNGEGRVEPFAAGERGWQITHTAFADVLRASAAEAGVVVERARVTAQEIFAAKETVVLDCTGRAGVVARARGWRVHDAVLKALALVGSWRGEWPLDDETHTVIESYADGWIWSVPTASGERVIAAMVDPRAARLEGDAARGVYLAELRKAPRFSALIANAQLASGPFGWDTSMYSATHYGDERVLLVGDAGSFIDPLSSAGVKKALASGWLAAVATHTALVRPAMRQTAFDFFAARERDMYERFRALTQQYLADAAGAHAHPFWTDRDLPERSSTDDVPRAYERLRAEPEFRVRRGAAVVEDRPAVSGCEIVYERRLVDQGEPSGVRYLHDVDVVELVQLAPQYRDVAELFREYSRRVGAVSLHDFLLALSTALARGWLVWA